MTKILLLTHGGWGVHLVKAVEMILGPIEVCAEVALTPNLTADDYEVLVREATQGFDDSCLIITDIMGGTTTNIALKVAFNKGINVITGLNAPLLIEACSQIVFNEKLDFESLKEKASDSIVDPIAKLKESMVK